MGTALEHHVSLRVEIAEEDIEEGKKKGKKEKE